MSQRTRKEVRTRLLLLSVGAVLAALLLSTGLVGTAALGQSKGADDPALWRGHQERMNDPWLPGRTSSDTPGLRTIVAQGPFLSVQVNVDCTGANISGDAANEPSIAVDPVNPNQIAIGWRQFDTVASNFRQAGYAYTSNAGVAWTFPGVLEPGPAAAARLLSAVATRPAADGGPPEVRLPITIRNQLVMLGPLVLVRFPRIRWTGAP